MTLRIAIIGVFSFLIALIGDPASIGLAQDSLEWPHVYRQGPGDGRYVAITFDDAPTPDTGELLAVLDSLDVRATFFVEGEFASWRPSLLQDIVNAGHEIGNHTYNHPNVTKVNDETLADELDSTNELIQTLTGVIPHLFRPPGGHYDSRVSDAAYASEMVTVLWSVNTSDYKGISSSEICSRVVTNVRPGAIILLHDGVDNTRRALPSIVNRLRERGYTIVTVGEMIEMTGGPCPWVEHDETWDGDAEMNVYF